MPAGSDQDGPFHTLRCALKCDSAEEQKSWSVRETEEKEREKACVVFVALGLARGELIFRARLRPTQFVVPDVGSLLMRRAITCPRSAIGLNIFNRADRYTRARTKKPTSVHRK